MPTGQTPICSYPQGGDSTSTGGRGIFRDAAGEPIRIWVDYMLKSARTIIQAARNEDDKESDISIASAFHDEPETQLIILHPTSHHIFDLYCHPDWLMTKGRRRYERRREDYPDEEEAWTRKVLLKEFWVGKCIDAGRFLGESDGWAGCRVGGPPKGQVVDLQMDIDPIIFNDGSRPDLTSDDMDIDMEIDLEMSQEVVKKEKEDVKPVVVPKPVKEIPIPIPIHVEVEPPMPTTTTEVEPLIPTITTETEPPTSMLTTDIKPPTPITVIEVELPTPHPLSANIRPDIGLDIRLDIVPLPTGEEDELESLFGEKEASPLSVRRSTRVSRSSSRFDQVKSELLSSDEEALATASARRGTRSRPGRSRSAADRGEPGQPSATASLAGLEDLDAAMLDSGPSSRFQSQRPAVPVEDGKIFSGLVFWVDLGMKNRGDLLKEIKTAGGKVAANHENATHVLIYKFAQQASQWKETISKLAAKGVWFLPAEWVKKSLAARSRLSEEDYVLPGGRQAGDIADEQELVVEYHAKIRETHDMAMEQDWSTKAVAKHLNGQYPMGPVSNWLSVYELWKRRNSCVHVLPDSTPVAKASAFAPLQETVLEVKTEATVVTPRKGKLSKPDLETIFAKEAWRYYTICPSLSDFSKFLAGAHGSYTAGSWSNYFSEWVGGRGRWASAPRTFHGATLSEVELSEGPVTTITTPRRDTVNLPDPNTRLPTSEMSKAFHAYFNHSMDRIVINASMGEHMEALYPAYSAPAWERMAREWKDGSQKFADFGACWDGDLGAVTVNEASRRAAEEPVVALAAPVRYSEEEELAMGQFVIHQESNGQPVTEGSWSIFFEVYPSRTKKAYSEHWRTHKERIRDTVKRYEATQEANRTDDLDLDPTYSERSQSPVASESQSKPKKVKVVVSRKDYEDLARFIVDNIAEGDVPDTNDFADFAKDHRERSVKGWYTIWHRDKYRSTLLPLIDGLRRQASRATPRAKSRPHPNAYTDEEERAMAEFIVRHVPSDRAPKVADWNRFQKTHTKRTAASWMEHYRVYKPRIDALVAEIAAEPSIARPPSGTAQDAIELGSDEEEVEEVEDIVPIRPPRKRGSDVIVFVD